MIQQHPAPATRARGGIRSRAPIVAMTLAVGLAAALAPAGTAAREVTLTGDPWPPYVNGTLGTEADGGVAVRLARRIFERVGGVVPRFPLIPWERALREVEAGTMDGIVLLARTAERERYMVYTDALITARSLVWYDARRHPDGVEWSRVEDLSRYLIGAVRGYDYGPDVARGAADGTLQLMALNSIEQVFRMLSRGRLDLALANDSVGHGLARDYAAIADLRAARTATGQDVYYMAFSRRSDAATLVERVNEAIAALRREGVIDALVRGE